MIPQDYNIGSSEMFAFTEEGVASFPVFYAVKPQYR